MIYISFNSNLIPQQIGTMMGICVHLYIGIEIYIGLVTRGQYCTVDWSACNSDSVSISNTTTSNWAYGLQW